MADLDLGVVFRPQLPPERVSALARTVEDAGVAELWFWEDCFLAGGIASASVALASTGSVRVGVGVLPVPLRNVALAAMEVAAICRMFPGRFLPGFGHGVLDWMGQVGARAESPMTLLREYLGAVRALLDGQQVSAEGRYVRLDGVRLDWPPLVAPALYAAAVGPRTLALTGELADATILTGSTSVPQVRQARTIVDQARRAANRPGRHRLTVYLPAATGPDAADRLAAERDSGLDPALELGVAGGPAAIADAVHRYAEAGADAVILQPTADEPDPEGFVRMIAEQVQPLVG